MSYIKNTTDAAEISQRNDERDRTLALIEVVIEAAIFLMAVIGNLLVVISLLYKRQQSRITRMYTFMLHLSVADLLVAFFNILPQMIWDITYRFRGGDLLCRFIKYMQLMSIYLSTYVLLMTAVDRYRAICLPLSNYSSFRRVNRFLIASAWIISIVLSLPQVIIFEYKEVRPGSEIYDCWADFNPEWLLQIYITFFSLFIYFIPLCVLLLLYSRICYEVWIKESSSTTTNFNRSWRFSQDSELIICKPVRDENNSGKPGSGRSRYSRTKIKTIKLTITVILSYIVCYAPFVITQLWWAFDSTAPNNDAVFVICLLLASLNSCCNPWIYMAFSQDLLTQLLPCFNSSKGSRLVKASLGTTWRHRTLLRKDQCAQNDKPSDSSEQLYRGVSDNGGATSRRTLHQRSFSFDDISSSVSSPKILLDSCSNHVFIPLSVTRRSEDVGTFWDISRNQRSKSFTIQRA